MSPEKSFWLIRDFLGNVISGRQRVRRLEALVLLLLGLAFALLLAPAAVMSQPLWGYSAVVYLGAIVLILAAVASRAAWILKRPPTREKIALEIETERGDLGNNLISSLQLFPTKDLLAEDDPTSPELIDALVFETAEQVEKLDPVIFVSNAAPRRMGRLLAALGATVMFVALSWPGVYPRAGYLLANAIDLMPSRITHLHLSASVVRILPGTNVLFDVRTEGMVPGKVALEILEPADAAAGADNRHGGVVPMEELGEHQFRLKWRAGDGDVRVLARSGRFRSAPVDIKVVAPPRTESIELVSYPPEYTPFPPSRQTESADIKAYLGTSIKVRVKPDKPVKEAVIALTDGWQIPLKPGKDGYLEGAMLVGSPGSYQIKLKDFDGFENLRPPRYRIDIIPDTSPQVTIAKPGKDVDMETDDAVRLLWRAKDDLGVQGVSLEVQIGRSAPRRIRLWGEERAKKIVKGTHVIDLRAYGMRPGGMLAYRIVAEDTDTVSGPKQGASPFYRVKIRNREAVIASLDSKLNEISSNLLDLLGDYIEKEEVPEELSGGKEPGRKTAREPGKAKQGTARTIPGAKEEKSLFDKAWEIMKKVKAAKSLLRSNNPREALASMDLTTLMRRLRDVMDRHLLSRHQMRGESGSKMTKKERRAREQERLSKREEATESMERLASMGEDMLRSVRMDQVGKTADSLMQRQRDLARALEQMRKSGEASPGAKSRLEKEVSRLQKELDKLMQQLSSLARRMPGEFMNQQSMRNMPMQNMRSAFDRIRQQMRKGDFRGALDTLRRLMNQIQQLRNAMRRLQRNQMSAQRGGQPMRRRQTELGAIVKEQQAVLSGTVDVHGNVMGRMTKGWPNSLKALSRRFEKSLAEERQLAERIIELDCGPKSISKTKETKAEGERKLEKALEAIRGALSSGGVGQKMPALPKLSEEDKRRAEKERREEGRRLHRTALDKMQRHLKLGDWRDVSAIIRRMREMVQEEPCIEKKEKDRAMKRWQDASKRLDSLLRKVEKRAPGSERRSLAELQKRQKALEDRLTSFRDRIRRMMQLYPFLDPKLLRRIEEARAAMIGAKGSLGERRASAAIPHEERVLELLAQSQRQMNRSMQQMARRGRLGRGTPRGAGGYRRPGRGWWARNPNRRGQDPSFRQGKQGKDGRQGTDFSEVLIPDREQYKVPEKFREEVMEALKEGLPNSLKSEIENYYERLTR